MGSKLCIISNSAGDANYPDFGDSKFQDGKKPVRTPSFQNRPTVQSSKNCSRRYADIIDYLSGDDKFPWSPREESGHNFKDMKSAKNLCEFGEAMLLEQQCQSVKLIGSELEIFPNYSCPQPYPEDITSFEYWDLTPTKDFDLISSDSTSSVEHSKSSAQYLYSEKRRASISESGLVVIPNIEAESGSSSSTNDVSTTITPGINLGQVAAEQDPSSPGSQLPNGKKFFFRKNGYKEMAMWFKKVVADGDWEKYAKLSEKGLIDAPTLHLDYLKNMGLPEHHAKVILTRVYPIAELWYTKSNSLLPEELFKLAASDKYSYEEKLWLTAQMQQHAQSRVCLDKQRQRIRELEAVVAKQDRAKELELKNQELNGKLLQTSEKCEMQTKRVEKLKVDLDQSLTEVERLEGLVKELLVEKNNLWEDLQVKKQTCEEQRGMLIDLNKKYSRKVKKLRQLQTCRNLDGCSENSDSASASPIAFDDIPSEHGEFFPDGHQEIGKLVAHETKTDERWRNSRHSVEKLLLRMTDSFGHETEISNGDKKDESYGKWDHNQRLGVTKLQRRDTPITPIVEESWFFECSNDAADDSGVSSNHPEVSSLAPIRTDLPILVNPPFVLDGKVEEASVVTPTGQLSPETLSSLIMHESLRAQETTSNPSNQTTAYKSSQDESLHASKDMNHSAGLPIDDLPEIMDFQNLHSQTSDEKKSLSHWIYSESFSSLSSIQDDTESCSSAVEVGTRHRLVEIVQQCFQNIVSVDGLLDWDEFSVALMKHFRCSSDLLRSVFDVCITYAESKISLDEFKEKVMWDLSEPFQLFRKTVFNFESFMYTVPIVNEGSGLMRSGNQSLLLRSPVNTGTKMLIGTNKKIASAGELGIASESKADFTTQSNRVQPRGLPADDIL